MADDFALEDITPRRIADAPMSVAFFARMVEKLAGQHGDGKGPVDPHIAAFFALVEMNDIAPGKRDASARLGLQDHLMIQAAVSRFHALVELERAGHLRHWSKSKGDSTLLHPALIAAACKARLLVRDEAFSFQPMEFLNLALNSAEANKPFLR